MNTKTDLLPSPSPNPQILFSTESSIPNRRPPRPCLVGSRAEDRWENGSAKTSGDSDDILNTTAVNTSGVTLIELLAVIAILALLAALLLPMMSRVTELSRRAMCIGNLRQIGIATQAYASENEGKLPLGYSGNYPMAASASGLSGYPENKGIIALLPYLGAASENDLDAEKKANVKVFFCPSGIVTFEKNWAGFSVRSSGYMQYCGWQNSFDSDYATAPSTNRDKQTAMIWSDLTTTDIALSNHRNSNDDPVGANCLFLDGHVEWKNISELTHSISRFGFNYMFLPNK